jgi:hypothetical protein
MNQAEAEAHLPAQVLPEVDDLILPDYDPVDLQDLQPGLFYYMGGNGGHFVGPTFFNFLAEYEGMQEDNYVFTFYKKRTKDPLGPWVNDIEQGVDFPIAVFQNRHIRLFTYNLDINLQNMNMNGDIYKRFKSYKTRKALKNRGKKTRRNHYSHKKRTTTKFTQPLAVK